MSSGLTAHPGPLTLDRGLKSYALAATAAGVGMLALTEPAKAEIVITHVNKAIPVCSRMHPCSVSIDLNKDGINDLEFQLLSFREPTVSQRSLSVFGLKGAEMMGTSAVPYASCLLRGGKIGPSAQFATFGQMEGSNGDPGFSRVLYGKWSANNADRFLGVKFNIKGKTHYGWVRVTVESSEAVTATITEYGYETVANKTVKAGVSGAAASAAELKSAKPATALGMLAHGADGLELWRRDGI